MNHFNPADWFIILGYLLGILGLGVWFGKDQKNTRDYFLGSKNVAWWVIGVSIVAAETSALTIIGVPAMAYGSNLTFVQMALGYMLARVILAVVMVPYYLRGEIYSPYQLLSQAFGAKARQLAGGFFLISETLAAGVRVYVACIPIQLMLGIQVLPAIFLFVALSLAYTYVGGVKAVIWTDAVQFALFLAGGIFTIWYIPSLLSGGLAGVLSEAAAAGKLQWLDPEFSLSLKGRTGFNIWMGLIGGTFITLSSHGAEQLIVQRVLVCKSVTDARKALALSAVLILPLFLIFLVSGAMLWVYYQHFTPGIPIPEARPGIKANDFIYPIFMLTAVPHGLKGFLIVAILAAAMSSVSSALTSLASVSTMDFVQPFLGRTRSDAFYLRFSKLSTLAWAGALMLVAYLSREVLFVLNAAFSLRGLTSGALLGALILTLFWKGGRLGPLLAGMSASLLFMIGVSLNWFWQARIDWPWFTLIGACVTMGVAYATRPLFGSNAPVSPDALKELHDERAR
jgi:solute:Na+ symporter, SSS family